MVTSKDSSSPFRFIFRDEAGKFAVDPTALEILRGMPCPVAVVGTCGAARLGKSTLLNMLLREISGDDSLQGFAVSGSTACCTQGLWLCASPPLASLPPINGVAPRVLFLDTEGLDAEDQNEEYMCQLFALSVLLSSVFLLNTQSAIDEHCLGRLSFVTAVASSIRAQVSCGHPAGSQALLWVLRDFYLELGGNTPDEYLKSKLKEAPTVKASRAQVIQEMKGVKASICSLFPRRRCLPLVRPALQESDLRRVDSMPQSELRPIFMLQFQDLAGAVVDLVGDTVLTGTQLAHLSEAFVSAINDGGIPRMRSAWESAIATLCSTALEVSELEYHKHILKSSWEMPQIVHNAGAAAALASLDTAVSSLADAASRGKHQVEAVHNAAAVAALGSFDKAASSLGDAAQEPRKRLQAFLDEQLQSQLLADMAQKGIGVALGLLSSITFARFFPGVDVWSAMCAIASVAWAVLIFLPSLLAGAGTAALTWLQLHQYGRAALLETISSKRTGASKAANGTGAAGATARAAAAAGAGATEAD